MKKKKKKKGSHDIVFISQLVPSNEQFLLYYNLTEPEKIKLHSCQERNEINAIISMPLEHFYMYTRITLYFLV